MKVQKLAESINLKKIDAPELDEELLVEGPISWIQDKIDPDGASKRAKDRQDKRLAKIQKKANHILAKDFDNVSAKATFYIDNNYARGRNQAQWRKWIEDEQAKIDDPKRTPEDKKAAAQQKLDAKIHNAIVIDENGYFIRRGTEFLEPRPEKFIPGENDQITNGYFMEPYKYKRTSGSKKTASKSNASGSSSAKLTASSFKKFQTLGELVGMKLFDADGKEVPIRSAKFQDVKTYKIKVGSVEMEAEKWLAAASKRGLI